MPVGPCYGLFQSYREGSIADGPPSSNKKTRGARRRQNASDCVGSDPFGQPSIAVPPGARTDPDYLVRESCSLNLGEREEGQVVQYLAFGAFRHFFPGLAIISERRKPTFVGSGMHSGAGRLPFGWSEKQFTDLTMIFVGDEAVDPVSRVYHHNHHGAYWHYEGHEQGCPKYAGFFKERRLSFYMDRFRQGLAEALTSVRPDKFVVAYSTTSSCQLVHSESLPSTGLTSERFASMSEALRTEHGDDCWLPFRAPLLDRKIVLEKIRNGSMTGFATVRGGSEGQSNPLDTVASANFGFCVQNYSVRPEEVSRYTKSQIEEFGGGGEGSADKYLAAQPARTLNSGCFHAEETVSTTYLRWLMQERGFSGFEITHLMLYKFANWSGDFLTSVLQARHDYKRAGNTVAAECLKLVGNGSFGYNGLESSNYTRLRLMTDDTVRQKRRTDLSGVEIQHLTMIGVVRMEEKKRKAKRRKRRGGRTVERRSEYVLDEASVREDDVDDDDDDDDEEESDANSDGDEGKSGESSDELERVLGIDGGGGDGEEEKKITMRFLYAVEVAGADRKIFNNIAKAVAILSNSKKLFLSHVNLMMQCLDPRLAELCYVDTDSCIWSQTYPELSDCLLENRRELWERSGVIADETGVASCHGKMKLEGLFSGGQFKTMKIYRLYRREETAYTRCKGINRNIGERLPEACFDPFCLANYAVHRTSLRPTKTGEIVVAHENKHLAIPFNLKRFVVDGGIHTLPFSSCLPDAVE